jgi:hypothetical protein
VVHGFIVALLSGSLASAEERSLGVLEAQLLLPMSMLRQWLIKVCVVFGICLVLSIGLPMLLSMASAMPLARPSASFAATCVSVAAVALYISSASTSGVKALVVSAPAALALLLMVEALSGVVSWIERIAGVTPIYDPLQKSIWLMAPVIVALAVSFALTNHRRADRSAMRLWRHTLWIVGSVALLMVIAGVV